MAKEKKKQTVKSVKGEKKEIVRTPKISTRGRVFKGVVTRKFPKRVTIELERTVKDFFVTQLIVLYGSVNQIIGITLAHRRLQ